MNHIEIEKCVIGAKEGDNMKLLKIMEQYKPFILKTAKEFYIKNYDINDLLQIGYITLINAVNKYKIGSHNFSAYAYNSIKNAFKYTARQNGKYEKELSLNVHISQEIGADAEFIDWISSDENIEEDMLKSEKIMEVRKAVAKLAEEEIDLIEEVYYKETPLKTYASSKGLSYFKVLGKRNKIFTKLTSTLKN